MSEPMKLNIGMVDVDLLNNGTRHPNLAQMKISGYCKRQGHNVRLLCSPDEIASQEYDLIIASKVFDFTPVPAEIEKLVIDNTSEGAAQGIDLPGPTRNLLVNVPSIAGTVEYYSKIVRQRPGRTRILIGGTGFFGTGGRDLDREIEHGMPDYDLYREYVEGKIGAGRERSYYSDYIGCSIGFITRGCFRKCSFCVNRKYDRPFINTDDISSFHKEGNRVIYLWDDNFLAIGRTRRLELLDKLIETGVPFQFRQGLDIRLIDESVAEKFQHCKYHGDFIFAFDHIQDKEIIMEKLGIWRRYCRKETKLYVLCGYDARSNDIRYGINLNIPVEKKDLIDIGNTFERIRILMRYGCLPYIMRYVSYRDSPYRGIYTQLARWCNQPSQFKKMSFEEFCMRNQDYARSDKDCAALRALKLLKADAPEIYSKYATLKFSEEREKDPPSDE